MAGTKPRNTAYMVAGGFCRAIKALSDKFASSSRDSHEVGGDRQVADTERKQISAAIQSQPITEFNFDGSEEDSDDDDHHSFFCSTTTFHSSAQWLLCC